jgi:membrane-associated phospholipid phosphatase
MPSAHARDGLAFFGYIGATLVKRLIWAAVIAIIILVCLFRVYLAVHFPTDILTGG